MGKKVIKLTEADIRKIVQKVIAEQGMLGAYNQLKAKVAGSDKGKAVQGSDNDLTTLVTLLPNKPSALDQKTHPRKSVLPPTDKIYSIKTANNGDLDFFRFAPGGYFNRHNWVVQTQGGKSRLGTFDVNGKKIYFKKFGVPQNQWYKDEGFTEVIDLGSLSVPAPKKDVPVDKKDTTVKKVKDIGGVRVNPTEDFVKTGRAFVESTMSGELVRKIQQALIDQGYLKIAKATNYFGPKTDAAVRAFQKAKGLKVDGKVGKNTYAALFTQQAEPERKFPEEITNIPSKGLASVTQDIQTPSPITKQGNIQTATY